jgi:hypothetical protein
MTHQEVLDAVGEFFIEAHRYDEPRLHEAMITAWRHIQEAMNQIMAEWEKEHALSADDLFRKHMIEIFTDLWKMDWVVIPEQTRAYFRYAYECECANPWFH